MKHVTITLEVGFRTACFISNKVHPFQHVLRPTRYEAPLLGRLRAEAGPRTRDEAKAMARSFYVGFMAAQKPW